MISHDTIEIPRKQLVANEPPCIQMLDQHTRGHIFTRRTLFLMDDLQLARPELAAIIGQRLRDVRRARGLSQQALADGLFSKGYVSSIEHGKIFPSVRALQALAARLGVDMSEFFDPALLAAQARPVPT